MTYTSRFIGIDIGDPGRLLSAHQGLVASICGERICDLLMIWAPEINYLLTKSDIEIVNDFLT